MINVGSSSSSVGDFSTQLLSVSPALATAGYPSAWTKLTATFSGLSGATSGRVAFRYFVPDGGASGSNSDFIGMDDLLPVDFAYTDQRALSGFCGRVFAEPDAQRNVVVGGAVEAVGVRSVA